MTSASSRSHFGASDQQGDPGVIGGGGDFSITQNRRGQLQLNLLAAFDERIESHDFPAQLVEILRPFWGSEPHRDFTAGSRLHPAILKMANKRSGGDVH